MAHIEDKSIQQTCVEQIEELLRQSFFVAERLVSESAARMNIPTAELAGTVPGVALEIVQKVSGLTTAVLNASPETLDRVIQQTDSVIRALTVRNKGFFKKGS